MSLSQSGRQNAHSNSSPSQRRTWLPRFLSRPTQPSEDANPPSVHGQWTGRARADRPTPADADTNQTGTGAGVHRPSRQGSGPLEIVGLQDLLAIEYPPTRWRIDAVLPSQGVAVLGGLPKAGKSLLSNQQALCIASGMPFLGQETVQGRVLLIEAEGSRPALQDRLRRQSAGLGISTDIPLFAPRGAPRLRLATDEGKERLDAAIRTWRPDVVILGPLAQLYALDDENAAHEMGKVVSHLIEVSQGYGLVIQLAHHLNKSAKVTADTASWFDGFRGSNALASGADALLGLARRATKETGALVRLQRDGAEEPIQFRFNPSTLLFERSHVPLGRPSDAGDRLPTRPHPGHLEDEVCRKLLEALHGDQERDWSASEMGRHVRASKNTARAHLEALTQVGVLVKRRVGLGDRYRLTDAAAPE